MLIKKNFKYLRNLDKLTQDEFAKKIGYKTRDSIKSIECGKITPSLPMLIEVCKLYNLTLDDLVFKDLENEE